MLRGLIDAYLNSADGAELVHRYPGIEPVYNRYEAGAALTLRPRQCNSGKLNECGPNRFTHIHDTSLTFSQGVLWWPQAEIGRGDDGVDIALHPNGGCKGNQPIMIKWRACLVQGIRDLHAVDADYNAYVSAFCQYGGPLSLQCYR